MVYKICRGFLIEKEILNGIIAPLLVILFLLFSVGSQVSQAGLEFSVVEPTTLLSFWSFYLYPLRAGIIGMHHVYVMLGIKLRASCTLGKHSTN